MGTVVDPAAIAEAYVDTVRQKIQSAQLTIRVRGLIASNDKPSLAYARATQQKFDSVGIDYDLQHVERLELEQAIAEANADEDIHGIFIYFPVFHNQQDDYLRNQVDYRKDIEAGSMYWTRKLYANQRHIEASSQKKALLPCTPLAIVKLLSEVGEYGDSSSRPLKGKTVVVFNRSEVIGRPLAVMLSNDGAHVYSFDINGPLLFVDAVPQEVNIDRSQALATADIVVTGVPHREFPRICAAEIRPEAICVNFSSISNLANDILQHARVTIPRVGPMTVAMCMRNTVRLFQNFHI